MHWYDHVLGREDGHILRVTSEFEVGLRVKRRETKKTCKKRIE